MDWKNDVFFPARNQTTSQAFVGLTAFLLWEGLKVPTILGMDQEGGVYVIENLGSTDLYSTTDVISRKNRLALYYLAVQVSSSLAATTNRALKTAVPRNRRALDGQTALAELRSFIPLRWVTRSESASWRTLYNFDDAFVHLSTVFYTPDRVITHRDFHARNLTVKHGELYMIDYQDVLLAPAMYDYTRLVFDYYAKLTSIVVLDIIRYIYRKCIRSRLARQEVEAFRVAFLQLGLQRTIKAASRHKLVSNRSKKIDDINTELVERALGKAVILANSDIGYERLGSALGAFCGCTAIDEALSHSLRPTAFFELMCE
jgi:aminoglycoside/choline kinase family phosphotransferase